MGLLSWFTTGGETVEKVTDGLIAGVDALVFTDEERAADAERRREIWYGFMQLSRDESSIKSITRRVLAFGVIGHWFLYLDAGLVYQLLGKDDQAAACFKMAIDLMWVVGPVATYYFGINLLKAGKK